MARLSSLQRKSALIRQHLINKGQYPGQPGETIPALNNITRSAFHKWITGQTSEPNGLQVVSDQLKNIIGISHPGNLLTDDVGIMQLGHFLGLSRNECRRAIDTLAGELGATFSAFSMGNADAEALLRLYRGLYVLYRVERGEQAARFTGRQSSILCATLIVRYSLAGTKDLTRDLARVRVKMNVPAYRKAISSAHEYDGYLTAEDSAGLHRWVFEERNDRNRDIIFIATRDLERGSEGHQDNRFMTGFMVGRTQDRPAMPAHWPIMVVRRGDLPRYEAPGDDFTDDIETRFSREHTGLFDPTVIDAWIREKLIEAEAFTHFAGGRVS